MQDSDLTHDVELTEINKNTGIVYLKSELSVFSELCEWHIKEIEKSYHIDRTIKVLMQVLTSSEVSPELQENSSVLELKNYITQSEQCRFLLKEKIKAMLIQQYNTIESIFFSLMEFYGNGDKVREMYWGLRREEDQFYQFAEMIIKEFIEELNITQTIKSGNESYTAMQLLAWNRQWEMIKFIANRKPTNKADAAGYCIALSICVREHAPNEVIASLIKALVKANASLDVDFNGNTGDWPTVRSSEESWIGRTTAIFYLARGNSYPLRDLTTEEVLLLKGLLGHFFPKLEAINIENSQKKYRFIEFTDKEILSIKQRLKETGRQDAKELCDKLIPNKDMVKLLLEGGANITFRDFLGGKTLIHTAAVNHDFEMVEFIASLRNTDEEDKAHFRWALFVAFSYAHAYSDSHPYPHPDQSLEDLVEERIRAIITLLKAGTPTQQISYPENNFTRLLKWYANTELLTEMAKLLKKVNFDFKYDNSGILEPLLDESKDSYLETQAVTPFWALPPSNSTATATTTAKKEQEEQQSTFGMSKK